MTGGSEKEKVMDCSGAVVETESGDDSRRLNADVCTNWFAKGGAFRLVFIP